jgi:hypothetical protein
LDKDVLPDELSVEKLKAPAEKPNLEPDALA